LAERRARALAGQTAALRAHDPERTLERGYALALDPAGEPLSGASAVRAAGDFELRMADGTVPARVQDQEETA
ncbi:MAG: exodeoxyribonuclease VII large subunit, partial [Actinomycetota bacterium]|nr:exodeoxyribonuclease VII large subunit [Actinomycetota bacterium]